MIGEKVPSKIDWWMHASVWGVTVLMAGVFAVMIGDAEISALFTAIFGIICFGTVGFMFWLYLGTYYILEDEYLFCKSGPITKKIPYESIQSLKLSNNALSSMALSSDRIEIREKNKSYMKGTTLISPINREEFYLELKKLCESKSHTKKIL